MGSAKVSVAEIKARGQLTIPKKIRDRSQLEEGQVVSIIPVGDSLIITPKRLELDEARREIKKVLKASGLSIEVLLTGLKEEEISSCQGILWKEERLGSFLTRMWSCPDSSRTGVRLASSLICSAWIYPCLRV